MNSALPRVALAALLVVGLSGCAFTASGAGPTVTPTGSPQVPVVGSDVDERCRDLLTPADYDGLWDESLESLGYTSYGASSTTIMAGTALVQSEALICGWVDQAGAPAALMIAMGGGADGFRRTEATFGGSASPYAAVPILDGAYVACRGEDSFSCHWDVLSGSDWISFLIAGLTAEQAHAANSPSGPIARLVSAAADAVHALRIPQTASGAAVGDCRAQLTPHVLAESFGVQAARIAVVASQPLEQRSLEDSSPEFGQMMWKYAYDLLGYSSCGIEIDGQVVGAAIIAPDAAWVLTDPDALQPPLEPVGDHGDGVRACTSDESSNTCTLAVTSGDALFLAQIGAPAQIDAGVIASDVLDLLV